MSEPKVRTVYMVTRVYQVFRWWGVGTRQGPQHMHVESVSSVPMVGCRNPLAPLTVALGECIKCSDGGVSEQCFSSSPVRTGVYQVFRWWGVGTLRAFGAGASESVSSVPMVGCRNIREEMSRAMSECIKCSDGGVSEPCGCFI